ncbi:general substrate transporter [Russula ochroleuca]|uniref:General substrate transporter n=1 Tax=Russula ochroleuca TaxID=152965 RepID=A0A9P5MUY1_9AGAM|nr:general substrate transporter [Russula ochroleuca]
MVTSAVSIVTTMLTFTPYGWLVCIWVLVVSFQYGYHISALNQIQATLTCRAAPPFLSHGLPTCIPMSDAEFSLVTSMFTVGGLLGSLSASMVMERHGRKAALQISGLSVAAGSGLMAIAPSTSLLLLGRFLTGCGAGIGLCTGPVFLAEIAPSNIRGSVGVLTQLAIVLGIMITQMLGLRMATPTLWRFVLLFSSAASVVQLCLSRFIVETPVWLKQHGKPEDSRLVQSSLFQEPDFSNSVEDPLLDETLQGSQHQLDDHREPTSPSSLDLLMSFELRRPLVVVSSAMISQQVSGINAILYYSNDIFSRVLPDAGPYVSLGITLVNTLMTFPPIFLIDRIGRRPLLLASVIGALSSLVLTGYGLNTGMTIVSSIAILTFVMSFAVGLGPVPFIIISEVAPSRAASTLSSVGLSLNWIANFIVGLAFLPLRNKLSGGDSSKEGRVFYIFAGVLFLFSSIFFRSYRPRTQRLSE